MSAPIRVLVADDSATVRRALCSLLREEPDLSVVGEAADGPQAVALARRLRPDVVTMDVMMPGLDGLHATEEIMAVAPTRVVVVSQLAATQQDLAIRALASGALELVAKPAALSSASDLVAWGRKVATAIRLMHEVPVITRRRPGAAPPGTAAGAGEAEPAPAVPAAPRLADLAAEGPGPGREAGPVHALGIASSTGGPQIVARLLADLPAELPIPILVAQHIADGFVDGLVRWFSQVSRLRVEVPARTPAPALPGRVYLPPAGFSLVLEPGGVLDLRRCPGALCPCGDVTLSSLAASLGPRAAGLVLSGMGEDGARGLAAIRAAGGLALAQDEATCVVPAMPRAAAALRAVGRSLTPEQMGPFVFAAARMEPRAGAAGASPSSTALPEEAL